MIFLPASSVAQPLARYFAITAGIHRPCQRERDKAMVDFTHRLAGCEVSETTSGRNWRDVTLSGEDYFAIVLC